jgi:hypothetical protein
MKSRRRRSGASGAGASGRKAAGFAVEQARKRSPEKCEPLVPVRARPRVTRRASAWVWCGNSGASVATTAMTDPAPGGADLLSAIGLSAFSSSPSGRPASTSSSRPPKFACRKTPTVYSVPLYGTRREAVPEPALNS